MRNNIFKLSLITITTLVTLSITSAGHAASIKERMAARIPAINSLMDAGAIGENNKGFLEYRSSAKPQQDVVNGENKDRNAVYKAIAQKQGASPALVGERRAKMIAQKGKKGRWYQKPDGTWFKK
ncbi:MAG: YdbL family protein [Desulforhopalus sp.]